MKKITIIFLIFFSILLNSCINPFAPGLAEENIDSPVIKDQKTISGVFDNFRYAYVFKDTLVYGNLLADDFTFIYTDYDIGTDVSWGRQEDIITTYKLFQATQRLDLVWNEVVVSVGDSLLQDISRGFTLTIIFSPTDIVNIQGRAILRLKRNSPDDIWKIVLWRDESNY